MVITEDKRNTLKLVANFLAHCFVIGFAMLMLVVMLFMFEGAWTYSIHSKWFHLDYETYCLLMLALMAALKMMLFLFFGIPWLAIRIILIKRH